MIAGSRSRVLLFGSVDPEDAVVSCRPLPLSRLADVPSLHDDPHLPGIFSCKDTYDEENNYSSGEESPEDQLLPGCPPPEIEFQRFLPVMNKLSSDSFRKLFADSSLIIPSLFVSSCMIDALIGLCVSIADSASKLMSAMSSHH